MGGSESSLLKGCMGNKAKKKKTETPEEDPEEIDDPEMIRVNKDIYFRKEDEAYIRRKYPDYDEWKSMSHVETSTTKPKPRRIKWKPSEVIGVGSFGKVVLGLNIQTGELMGVKQVDIGHATSNDTQNRIEQLEMEIEILSRLKHKNIVRYIGSEKSATTLNIFLEYVTGGNTIASLLEKYGKFSEQLIRVYTKQILEGLEYLHIRHTVHRDIKGSNILVDNSSSCKIADFGTAKKLSSLFANDPKVAPSLKGTVHWMAPEVIRQEALGRFSDIWSLGCTVIEMATGRPPWSGAFRDGNQFSFMFQIAKTNKPPPIPKDLSPEAIDFLNQCLHIVPDKRANVIQLLQHKFIRDGGEPMYSEVYELTTTIEPSTPGFVTNSAKTPPVKPVKARQSFASSALSASEVKHNKEVTTQMFNSAPGEMRQSRFIQKEESKSSELKIKFNEKKLEQKLSNTSIKINKPFSTNTSPENREKKILKINEMQARNVLYESDRDIDESADSRITTEVRSKAKAVTIVNKEKVSLSINNPALARRRTQEASSTSYTKKTSIPIKSTFIKKQGEYTIQEDEESPNVKSNTPSADDKQNIKFFSDHDMKMFTRHASNNGGFAIKVHRLESIEITQNQRFEKYEEKKVATDSDSYKTRTTAPTTFQSTAESNYRTQAFTEFHTPQENEPKFELQFVTPTSNDPEEEPGFDLAAETNELPEPHNSVLHNSIRTEVIGDSMIKPHRPSADNSMAENTFNKGFDDFLDHRHNEERMYHTHNVNKQAEPRGSNHSSRTGVEPNCRPSVNQGLKDKSGSDSSEGNSEHKEYTSIMTLSMPTKPNNMRGHGNNSKATTPVKRSETGGGNQQSNNNNVPPQGMSSSTVLNEWNNHLNHWNTEKYRQHNNVVLFDDLKKYNMLNDDINQINNLVDNNIIKAS
jgi:mitogen-activated protein kinase kinase kinase